jgi:hypothetical protein
MNTKKALSVFETLKHKSSQELHGVRFACQEHLDRGGSLKELDHAAKLELERRDARVLRQESFSGTLRIMASYQAPRHTRD